MEDEDESMMDASAIMNENVPLLWTRKLSARLLSEYKLHGPKLGTSIRSMNVLHSLIAKNMRNEFKIEITANQVSNKLKSLKRKYQQCQEKGKPILEFGQELDEAMELMDRLTNRYVAKTKRSSLDRQNEAAIQSIKSPNDETYSIEIIDDNNLQNQDSDMMDIHQFLSKSAKASKSAIDSTYQDPLEGDVVTFDRKLHQGGDKFDLLEKKLGNQEKNLEGKLRKNELIEERNRLIATLLTKKTKNDVIDAIRKDRLQHHQEMRGLWAQRLEVEKKKLQEKKRKNDLLEERNKLMKALIKETSKKKADDIGSSIDDDSPAEVNQTIELE